MAPLKNPDVFSRKSFRLAVILASLAALASFTSSEFNPLLSTAQAATFVVTTTTDNGNNANPTPGSLRRAILDANANGNGSVDTIVFKIPGAGVHTIKPTVVLPTISTPTIVDGYTQAGSQKNTLATGTNAVLNIELNGELIVGVGLNINANVWVKGLVINHFKSPGIYVSGGRSVTIVGNFIGTDPAGLAAFGNSSGIYVENNSTSITVVVGGTLPADRNIISGNHQGIAVLPGSPRLIATGNLIGTDKNAAGNLGNLEGISSGTGAQIKANFVAHNVVTGIKISGPDCVIGGETPADRNVIILNGGQGIYISSVTQSTGAKIIGNSIGTDASGTLSLGNKWGILIDTDDNFVGGPSVGQRNIISANGTAGIEIRPTAHSNSIRGNYIGTDASGTAALPNLDGVSLNGGDHNTIGGPLKGEGNLISGNTRYGVNFLNDAQTNLIKGNLIGTKANGTSALANADGVHFDAGKFNAIGGAGGKNVIAFNSGRGVSLEPGVANLDNLITENSIFSNGGLGIDLGANGLNANDLNDVDSGANYLQNFPLLTSASSANGQVTISGTLNSTTNSNFTIHFYGNTVCDPSGHGEGQTFLGSISVTTVGNNASFTASFQVVAKNVTATATNSTLSTSEFSLCKPVVF